MISTLVVGLGADRFSEGGVGDVEGGSELRFLESFLYPRSGLSWLPF